MHAEGPTVAGHRPPARATGCHDAVLYASDGEFVDAAGRHLREGAERGEKLVLACTGGRAELLLDSVDGLPAVTQLGNDDTYLTPCGAMDSYLAATRRAVASGATGLRVVGELPPGTQHHPHTWPGWSRYEAAVNRILTTVPFNALCAYDSRRTDHGLLAAVRSTHPRMWRAGAPQDNPDYLDPDTCLARWADPPVLPIEASPPLLELTGIRDLAGARRARGRVGALLNGHDTALQPHAQHLPPADPTLVEVSDYLVGIDEVLVNALTHGAGTATLRLWADHDSVVTTVTDAGEGFDDPYRGWTTRSVPGPDGRTHRELGLWLTRQTCDELTFRRDDEGFTVRLRADLDVRFP